LAVLLLNKQAFCKPQFGREFFGEEEGRPSVGGGVVVKAPHSGRWWEEDLCRRWTLMNADEDVGALRARDIMECGTAALGCD
jgi:hypothetical protein